MRVTGYKGLILAIVSFMIASLFIVLPFTSMAQIDDDDDLIPVLLTLLLGKKESKLGLDVSINGVKSYQAPGYSVNSNDGGLIDWRFSVSNNDLESTASDVEIVHANGTASVSVCTFGTIEPGETKSCLWQMAKESPGDHRWQTKVSGIVSGVSVVNNRTSYYRVRSAIELNLESSVATGYAPLTVVFTPVVDTNGTTATNFSWDFDGDGVEDDDSALAGSKSYVFSKSGTYTAMLTVTDSTGAKVTASKKITVLDIQSGGGPRVVYAAAEYSTGAAPFWTRLYVKTISDVAIKSIEWDYTGDGEYDYKYEPYSDYFELERYRYVTYQSSGSYSPVIRVTDKNGRSTVSRDPMLKLNVGGDGTPRLKISAGTSSKRYFAQYTSTALQEVSFDGYASTDSGNSVVEYQWDFDGDGAIDQTTTSRYTEFTYNTSGTFHARVTVVTANGLKASDIVSVVVNPLHTIKADNKTLFNTPNSDVAFTVALEPAARVRVVIEDSDGEVVRSLSNWQTKAAGSHTYRWSGYLADGTKASQGKYRGVLLVDRDGTIWRVSPSDWSVPETLKPDRTRLPDTFSASDPLIVTFTLDEPAEVSAFTGSAKFGDRKHTFYERELLPAGEHTVTWDGRDVTGNTVLLTPGDSFRFGLLAIPLVENEFFVYRGIPDSQKLIGNASATPAIIGQGDSRIEVEVLRKSNVDVQIVDSETNAVLKTFQETGVIGTRVFSWDGKDSGGRYLSPSKRYTVLIFVKDVVSNKQARKSLSVATYF